MDIQGRNDVQRLLEAFYTRVIPDPVIGHFFTDVVQLDLEHHIPRLTDFWAGLLFGEGKYQGNPMEKHVALDALSPLHQAHFTRWVELFHATVDEMFQGPIAEEAKSRATGIAAVMRTRIERSGRGASPHLRE